MEVEAVPGKIHVIKSTVTDIGGNYHFTNLDTWYLQGRTCSCGIRMHSITSRTHNKLYTFPPQTSIILSSPVRNLHRVQVPTGRRWKVIQSSLLHGIWGSSGSNIFAVGDNGDIISYDGNNWNNRTSGTGNNLKGVWGSSASEVYAVGDRRGRF